MAIPAPAAPSFPSQKRRCWELIITATSRSVKEAEVLACFRKRYTSARKIEFNSMASIDPKSATTLNDTTVQVEFTGPQPIKGPAELMCRLWGGSSVVAVPIFMTRGRRRKRTRTSWNSAETEAAAAEEHPGHSGNSIFDSAYLSKDCCRDGEVHEMLISEEGLPAAGPDGAADAFFTWDELDPEDLDEYPQPRPPLTSLSSSASLGTYSSSTTLLSDCDQVDIHANLALREAAKLFEDVDKAVGEWAFAQVDIVGDGDAADNGQTFPDEDAFNLCVNESEASSPNPSPLVNTNTTNDNAEQHHHRIATTALTTALFTSAASSTDAPFNFAGQAGSGPPTTTPDYMEARQERKAEEESWVWFGAEESMQGGMESGGEENAVLGWLRQVCDFDGRPTSPSRRNTSNGSTWRRTPNSPGSSSGKRRFRLRFKGCESLGYAQDLSVTAQFSVGPTRSAVGMAATPLEADGSDCAIFSNWSAPYPSMEEIWPEVYSTRAIKVIEVNMVVEVRSSDGECLHRWPPIKVTYRRARAADTSVQVQRCTRIHAAPHEMFPTAIGQRPCDVDPAGCSGVCQSAESGVDNDRLVTRKVPSRTAIGTNAGEMEGPPEDSFAALLISR